MESKRTRNSRFERSNSPFLICYEGIFESYDAFDKKSKELSKRFRQSLTQAQRKDFLLIIFDTTMDDERFLGIITMEAKDGVRLNGDILSVISDVLPESGTKSKKAAIIFEKESMNFKNEIEIAAQEDDVIIRHAVVIDRQTPDITNLFMKFLDSEIIPDKPTAVTKILLKVFPTVLKRYLKPEFNKRDLQNEIRNLFSTCRESTFDNVTSILATKYLSEEKMTKDNIDIDDLSSEVFNEARKRSSAINRTFTAESSRFSKNIFKDLNGGKNINLIISESSIDEGDVKIEHLKDEKEPYITVKVKRNAIDFKKI